MIGNKLGTIRYICSVQPRNTSEAYESDSIHPKTAKKNDLDSKATIYFRLRDGKKDIKAASELSISPNHWSPEKQGYKDRVALVPEDEKMDLNHKVQALTRMIEKEYRDDADSEWLGEVIDRFHHPDKYKTEEELAAENPPSFAELFDEFLEKHSLSEVRKRISVW